MKKNLKVALYNPYLDVLGGGEKHILSLLKVLSEEGYEPYIFWDRDLREKIEKQFSLKFPQTLKFLPNIFKNKKNLLQKLLLLKDFDILFYVTDGSYFFSTTKKNFIYAMVPDKKLYQINIFNKLKLHNFECITHSYFVKNWLDKWGIKSQVIYPYINDDFLNIKSDWIKKEKIILSVGRFFPHLHSKRHEIIIETFKKIKHASPFFKSFRLILAGALKDEDKQYFNHLKKLANNDSSIIFKPNLNFDQLYQVYKLSAFFWHFTGFGIDEEKHPEQVEHLGITPLEAMTAGAIAFCYNAGGPKELIKDDQTGFLFNNQDELIEKHLLILNNKTLAKNITLSAKKFIKENFSYSVFKNRVKEIILNL